MLRYLDTVDDEDLGRLVASIGTEPGKELQITRGDITVGRHNSNELVIPELTCSNCHLRFYVSIFDEEKESEPLVYCEDFNSTNGTWINGKCIQKGQSVLLFDGDTIEIVQAVTFVFLGSSTRIPAPLDEMSVKDQNFFAWPYTLTNRVLGNGSYGKVHLAWDKKNHDQVACKIVNMDELTTRKSNKRKASDWKRALREVEILMGLSHPNVINIREYFRTNARIYIFEELITHGDLFSFMDARDHCVLEEEEAMPIAWQLLKALEYLHQNGIVHRDLKPENILCANRDICGRIVLTDFGTARPLKSDSRTLTAVGTVQFCAPEISVPSPTGYTTAVDLWSLGVIIHGLLYGTHEELTWYLHQGDFRHLNTCTLSDLAKDFIKKLLCIDPKKRMTAKEAMEHRWLSNHEEKLEVLYQKATKNWKGESAIVLDGILNIDSDVEDEEPSEQLSNDSGRSDISMRDVPVLVSMESPSSLGGSELEASGWANIQEDQLLYDSVARDGKLRTAAQLAREAESMRAGKKDLSGLWPKLPLPSPRKRVDTETSMEIETDLDETSMHSRHGSYYSDY